MNSAVDMLNNFIILTDKLKQKGDLYNIKMIQGIPFENTMSFTEACWFVRKLNDDKFGGYDDWQIPNILQLKSIYKYRKDIIKIAKNECIENEISKFHLDEELNTRYWSTSYYDPYSNNILAFSPYGSDGCMNSVDKSSWAFLRIIR